MGQQTKLVLIIGGVAVVAVVGYFLLSSSSSTLAKQILGSPYAGAATIVNVDPANQVPTTSPVYGDGVFQITNITEPTPITAKCAVPTQYPSFLSLAYGAGSKVTNDITKANQTCTGKNPCVFAGNDVFGDPNVGVKKTFRGSFVCKG